MKNHTILFRSVTPEVQEKLYRCFEEINKKRLLELTIALNDLPLHIDPKHIAPYVNSLIFFEINPHDLSGDKKILDTINDEFYKSGNQTVLICSDEYDFFEFARTFNIGNILLSNKFDMHLVLAITKRLLGDHFFGPAPFFPLGFPKFDKKYSFTGLINTPGFAKRNFNDFRSLLPQSEQAEFNSFVSELMINALSYSVQGITPEQRDTQMATSPKNLYIPEDKMISFRIVQDEEKYAISIKDKSGSLTLRRILEKFRRHTRVGNEQLPLGLTDATGRGLFMLSRQNRLIINILNGVQTEIILIHFTSEELNKYQSLIINERNPDYTSAE